MSFLHRIHIPLRTPISIKHFKERHQDLEPWEQNALDGLIALRDGKDYVNNNHRYELSYDLLSLAYQEYLAASRPKPNSQIERDPYVLAKLSLWKGIALNENLDILDPVARNDRAIAHYRRGLAYLKNHDDPTLRMSLQNSLGVAYHHRNGQPIPPWSFKHYRAARALYDPTQKQMRAIMRKVVTNSGRQVGFAGGGEIGWNVVV